MPGSLLIAAGPGEWRAAWVEGGTAVELYVERGDTPPPGSIHLGRVVRRTPGLDAVLVDIGTERRGFLPVGDAPRDLRLDEGARLLVQVRREAILARAGSHYDPVILNDWADAGRMTNPDGTGAGLRGLAECREVLRGQWLHERG